MTLRVVREKENAYGRLNVPRDRNGEGAERREKLNVRQKAKGKRVDLTDTQGAVGRCPAERRGKAGKYRPSLHRDSLSLSRHTFTGIIPFLYICD